MHVIPHSSRFLQHGTPQLPLPTLPTPYPKKKKKKTNKNKPSTPLIPHSHHLSTSPSPPYPPTSFLLSIGSHLRSLPYRCVLNPPSMTRHSVILNQTKPSHKRMVTNGCILI